MKKKKFNVNISGYLKNFNKENNFVKNKKFVNKKSISKRNLFIKNDIYYPERKKMFFRKFDFKKHIKEFKKDNDRCAFYNYNLIKISAERLFKYYYNYNKNLFSSDEKNSNYDFTKKFIECLVDYCDNSNFNSSVKPLVKKNNIINNSFFDYYKKIFEIDLIKKKNPVSKLYIRLFIRSKRLRYVRYVSLSRMYKPFFKKMIIKAYNDFNLTGFYGYRNVRLLYNNRRFLFKIEKRIKKIPPNFFVNYFNNNFYYLLKNRNKKYFKFKKKFKENSKEEFKKNLMFSFDYVIFNYKLQKQKLIYYRLGKLYDKAYE